MFCVFTQFNDNILWKTKMTIFSIIGSITGLISWIKILQFFHIYISLVFLIENKTHLYFGRMHQIRDQLIKRCKHFSEKNELLKFFGSSAKCWEFFFFFSFSCLWNAVEWRAREFCMPKHNLHRSINLKETSIDTCSYLLSIWPKWISTRQAPNLGWLFEIVSVHRIKFNPILAFLFNFPTTNSRQLPKIPLTFRVKNDVTHH